MFRLLEKFKIPTLLGLGVILVGTISLVFLTLRSQTAVTKASTNLNPQNIRVTNLEDQSATISWQTAGETTGFISYGVNSTDKVALDDRDASQPSLRFIHYVTIKALKPQTTYQYKITSGKLVSDTATFTTGLTISAKNDFQPIIGSVLDDKTLLGEGIAYLEIKGAVSQSALIKNLGSFIIPTTSIRTEGLSSLYIPSEEDTAKLVVLTTTQAKAQATLKLSQVIQHSNPVGPLVIGQDLSLLATPTPTPTPILLDLNGDWFVNSSDYAIVLKNFGKSPKDKRADLNSDGVVDKLDLDIISKEVFKPAR